MQSAIESRLAPTGYSIDISSFYTSGSEFNCDDTVPTLPGGGRLQSASHPDGELPSRPTVRSLSGAYPNPSRTRATLDLVVPERHIGRYALEVYDVTGRRIVASEREIAAPGTYKIEWSGRDSRSARVANGVYFIRLRGPGEFTETRKVTVLR